jgi:hypothetical protein
VKSFLCEKFLLELICYLALKSSMNVNGVTIDTIEGANQDPDPDMLQNLYKRMVIDGFDVGKKDDASKEGNAMCSEQFCFCGINEKNVLELTFLEMCIRIANCIWNYKSTKSNFGKYGSLFPIYLQNYLSPIMFLYDVIMSTRSSKSRISDSYWCFGQNPDGTPIVGGQYVRLFVNLSDTPKFGDLPKTIQNKFETVVAKGEKTEPSLSPGLEAISTGKKNSWLSRSPSPRERRITNALLIFFCIICPTALFLIALNGMIHVVPIFILPHLDFIANLFVGIAAEVFACIFAVLVIFRIVRNDEDQNKLFERGRPNSWKAFCFRVIGAHETENVAIADEHPHEVMF